MSESTYIFDDAESQSELERLRAIEAEFDEATRRELSEAGLSDGWRCLEVGAGAGSIARWMAERVGPGGYVAAIDVNPRFLSRSARANVGVIEGDIRHAVLEPEVFDLAHARYVLIHIPDWQTALHAMLHGLKPGGWLVLEEPDFSVAEMVQGDDDEARAFDNIKRAIAATFAAGGKDHAIGTKLEQFLRDSGLENFTVGRDAPTAQGSSRLATMMGSSARQLRAKYLKTGETSPEDIESYIRAASNPDFRATYYETVRVRAQKPQA